jgi:hypothetical protein
MVHAIPKSDKLLVEVHDGRYDCYGDPANPNHMLLMQELTEIGGVNESVPDGYYHFYFEYLDEENIALTLEPYQE